MTYVQILQGFNKLTRFMAPIFLLIDPFVYA